MRNSMSEIFNDLPEVVKRLFVNTDCTLTEVDEIKGAPTAVGAFMHSNAIHYYGIEVKRESSFSKENVAYHEFGHLLDYGYGECYRSKSEIFMEIYNAEKDHFVVDDNYEYAVSTPQEYFAESFAEYMTNPDRLRDNTPMTYNYIEHVLRITDIEEVLYAKQIAYNRKYRIIIKEIEEIDDNAPTWEKLKVIIRYKWLVEETLWGKLKSIAKLVFGR